MGGVIFLCAVIMAIVMASVGMEVVEWRRKRRIEKRYRDYKNTRIKK